MDCDRVLVMHAGKVVEFDAPAALCQTDRSVFHRLVGQREEWDGERDTGRFFLFIPERFAASFSFLWLQTLNMKTVRWSREEVNCFRVDPDIYFLQLIFFPLYFPLNPFFSSMILRFFFLGEMLGWFSSAEILYCFERGFTRGRRTELNRNESVARDPVSICLGRRFTLKASLWQNTYVLVTFFGEFLKSLFIDEHYASRIKSSCCCWNVERGLNEGRKCQ